MKKWLKVTLAVPGLALIAFGAMKWNDQRQQSAAAAQQARSTASEKARALVELSSSDVAPARIRELTQGLPISGTLRAANWAVVKARVAGELQGLTLREGDSVKAAQVVARIDPSDYQARVRQAREQADAAKAQIAIAQRQWDNNKALVDQGFISRTSLEASQANLSTAQANHQAALAAVDMAAKALDDTILRAPISGVVSQRLAQPGERVGVDAKVLEIIDMSRLELEASITAADSLQLRIGQAARLRVEGTEQSVTARVIRINPIAQSGSRTVLAYLSIDKPAGLRQGLFAQGLVGSSAAAVLSVPLTSVRTDKPSPYLQVIEGNRVSHRPVQLGARGEVAGEIMVEVQGIAENALVLGGHVGALREGAEVKYSGAAAAAAAPVASAAAK